VIWLPFVRVQVAGGGYAEGVALAVLEEGVGAPGLGGGGLGAFHPLCGQFLVGFLQVRGLKGHVDEGADAVLLPGWSEQGEVGLPSRDGDGDPALLFVKGNVPDHREPELFRIKTERPVLVRDGDADEFDFADHRGK